MILWPSISASEQASEAPEPVALPSGPVAAGGAFPQEFPWLAKERAPLTGAFPNASETGDGLAVPPARRRWNVAVLAASLTLHAAAIAGFGALVAHEGLEAETDAISVEIVIESAPEPAAGASVAGDANETRDAAAPVDGSEPGARTAEPRPDISEPMTEQAETSLSVDPAAPALLPRFEPLPPLTDIAAHELEDVPASAESVPDPEIDIAAALPVFSPLPPLAGDPVAPAAPEETTERQDAPEPVLAVRPSLESMLPAISVPDQPLFPPAAEPKPAASAPSKKPDAAAPERKTVEKPPASTARKTETRSAAAARVEKPKKPKAAAGASPPGGAKAKGKSQQATRAGSVASAAASSGDKEAYGRKVNSHVQRYKRYPDAAARGGMKGAVKVSISIGGSGNLASARVTSSSGYPVLDGEALATVRRAAPYPKPPAGFAGTARFSLTLRYSK
ncbi:MAG: TonB family protein [Pseudomonadota bacterium]